MTADNPVQQERITHLETLARQKISFMSEMITDAPGKSREVLKSMANGRGVSLMSDIQLIAQQMKDDENHLLIDRTQEEERIGFWVRITSIGLSVLLVAVLAVALLTIQRELTRRRLIERALRESSAFQDALLCSAPYAVIACEKSGIIKMFNSAAEKMLGYRAEELVGKESPAVFHDQDEIVARAAELTEELGRIVEPGFDVFRIKPTLFGPEQREWIYRRKDGTTLPVQLIITAVPDGKGGAAGYFGIAEDITERKHIEQMKNEFISTVSHELRTPLTSIRGSLSLILAGIAGTMEDKVKELIGIAYNNTERLVRLINDILDIEKIESGSMNIDLGPVEVGAILQQAVNENNAFALKYHVQLAIEDKTGKALVEASCDHLLQILTNLLSNAVKFSPPGDTVTLAAEPMENRIRFTITDNGSGIPVEFHPRIFEKFSQADSSSSRSLGGTGLGLNICKALIEKMGGSIGFHSVPGRTEFFFDLPQAIISVPVSMPHSLNGKDGRKRILIVEDDADIANLLRLILAQENLECEIAASASQAKALLAANDFTAMTLDLELPDQDGLLLLRDLRGEPRTLALPVIVISIRAEEDRKNLDGHAFGILDWLQKPIDIKRLQHVLCNVASNSHIPSVMHVEDDADMAKVIALSLAGKAVVSHAATLATAQELLRQRSFDLAILDNKLPDGSGLDLLPSLIDHMPPIPVIILSATETPKEMQKRVQASLIKSVVSEEKIISIIKQAILNGDKSGSVE